MIRTIYSTLALLFCINIGFAAHEITPHKFTDDEMRKGGPAYKIPKSSRFTTKRPGTPNVPDIIYYLSKPQNETFPIAILCGGSSLQKNIFSIIHFHRYFLKEFLDLGVAVLTVEQQGVDGSKVNVDEFMRNYTRSSRLSDHRAVIEHLKENPPLGWNGELIFLGVSEGGPIAMTLTSEYPDITIATMNLSGAGDFSWRDELWDFICDLFVKVPWYIKLLARLSQWIPFPLDLYLPKSRQEYDQRMEEIIKNPMADLKFLGMTYKYHADAMQNYPKLEYEKIKTPLLVVTGVNDSILASSDAFVQKARQAGVSVPYMRVEQMDHYVRKRPDIIAASFDWLKMQIKN